MTGFLAGKKFKNGLENRACCGRHCAAVRVWICRPGEKRIIRFLRLGYEIKM